MNSKFYRNYSTKKDIDLSNISQILEGEGEEITKDKEKESLAKISNLNKNAQPIKRTKSNHPLLLTDYLKEALIGLTLGDLSLEKSSKNSNVRLRFDQSIVHSSYLNFLYDKFKEYTLTPPKFTISKPDKRTGQIYYSLIFKTRLLPCFNYLWDLFYKEGKKIIPSNIKDLLTEVGLAYWIMNNRGLGKRGVLNLNTGSYTEIEIELLMSALTQKFNLKCRKSLNRSNQCIIVIPKSQVNQVADLTYKHFHPSMYYKIGR
jgi:hypothetical protein